MQFRVASLRSFAVGLSGLGLLLGSGCGGGDGLEQRYPVSGRVTYRDKPLEQGTIAFLPTNDQERPATGTISNGEYTLSTIGDRDGALPGNYRVTIASKSADESKHVIPKYGGQPTPESRRAALKTSKSLLPPKYGQPASSGLTYTVKAESNRADFELKN
jgi:hypothetical protein